MKIERRSDSPAPTQSQLSNQQPHPASTWFNKYGTRLLLAVTLIVLAVAIVRYRIVSNERRVVEAQNALSRARTELETLQQTLLTPSPGDPEPIAMRRDQLFAQIISELGEVLADTGDGQPVLRAEHYATRGDLFWTLANSPTFPQATTRPALAMKASVADLLANAESDYRQVVDNYPKQVIAWITAEIGLAAIAENRHNWDEAAKRYHEIVERPDLSEGYRDMALQHIDYLSRIQKPVQIGALTTQPTTTTVPSTQTAAADATMPATTESAASTAPATTQPTR